MYTTGVYYFNLNIIIIFHIKQMFPEENICIKLSLVWPPSCCTNALFVFDSLTSLLNMNIFVLYVIVFQCTFDVTLIFNAVNFTSTLRQNDETNKACVDIIST